ncbi:MAG: hypothetical protein IPP72_18515 [Chitinophagaceae bacterium]|nr:hypothetical protein [Chitinophagaceae bacterium]
MFSFSQNNITGTWDGMFLSTQFNLGQPKLVVEIYNFKDSIFTGITHLYYEDDKYEHYKTVGRYFKKDSILVFIESETIAVDLGFYGNCLGTYMMKLKKQGIDLLLDGIWDSNIRGCSPTTKVYLKKRVPAIPPPVTKNKTTAKKTASTSRPATGNPLKKTTTVIETAPTVPVAAIPKNIPAIKAVPFKMPVQLTQRETDVQSLLEIASAEKDSIKVEVYDNGEIDGDSVSVYEEHVLRINKKMITAKPITFYVSLDKNTNPISHLRLVAESLGSIPPCTALMIVTTKSKRYEVRLSSNYKKNATVELFLKE